MTTTHDTYVYSFNGAGQKNHRAQCRNCLWHGPRTTDRERATTDAAQHAVTPSRAGART